MSFQDSLNTYVKFWKALMYLLVSSENFPKSPLICLRSCREKGTWTHWAFPAGEASWVYMCGSFRQKVLDMGDKRAGWLGDWDRVVYFPMLVYYPWG